MHGLAIQPRGAAGREHVVVERRSQAEQPLGRRQKFVGRLLSGLVLAATGLEPLSAASQAALAARLPRGGRPSRPPVLEPERRRGQHAGQPASRGVALDGGEEPPSAAPTAPTASAPTAAAAAATGPPPPSSPAAAAAAANSGEHTVAEDQRPLVHDHAGAGVANREREAQPCDLHHLRREQSARYRHDIVAAGGHPSSGTRLGHARRASTDAASAAHDGASVRDARGIHCFVGFVSFISIFLPLFIFLFFFFFFFFFLEGD